MQVSAEVRWFWKQSLPAGLEDWFRKGAIPPGGGSVRVDIYCLDPDQSQLGLKKRGGSAAVEIKGLVEQRPQTPAPFAGQVQIWAKWTLHAINLDACPQISVRKTRWLRKFDTGAVVVSEIALDEHEKLGDASLPIPRQGCNLELVQLHVGDAVERWWSLGFEAFGALDSIERNLRRTIAFLEPSPPEPLSGALELSYPAWLSALQHRKL